MKMELKIDKAIYIVNDAAKTYMLLKKSTKEKENVFCMST
jgi:hypothetical protein